MNESVQMNISSVIRKDGNKAIYVLFSDGDKCAEFILPDKKVLKNSGFSVEELKKLKDYLENDLDRIYSMANKVKPLNGFLGKKQG